MENLSFRQFWARCFKDAFTKGWAIGGLVSAILSLIVPFAPLFDPYASQHQTQWAWVTAYSVALATLGAIWIVAAGRLLVYAPYKVYLESQNKHLSIAETLQKQLGDKDTLLLQHDSQRQNKQSIEDFRKIYLDFARDGDALKDETGWPNIHQNPEIDKIIGWQKKVEQRLGLEIQPHLLDEYKLIKGAASGDFDTLYQREQCSKLDEQIKFLRRIVKDPTAFMLPS